MAPLGPPHAPLHPTRGRARHPNRRHNPQDSPALRTQQRHKAEGDREEGRVPLGPGRKTAAKGPGGAAGKWARAAGAPGVTLMWPRSFTRGGDGSE